MYQLFATFYPKTLPQERQIPPSQRWLYNEHRKSKSQNENIKNKITFYQPRENGLDFDELMLQKYMKEGILKNNYAVKKLREKDINQALLSYQKNEIPDSTVTSSQDQKPFFNHQKCNGSSEREDQQRGSTSLVRSFAQKDNIVNLQDFLDANGMRKQNLSGGIYKKHDRQQKRRKTFQEEKKARYQEFYVTMFKKRPEEEMDEQKEDLPRIQSAGPEFQSNENEDDEINLEKSDKYPYFVTRIGYCEPSNIYDVLSNKQTYRDQQTEILRGFVKHDIQFTQNKNLQRSQNQQKLRSLTLNAQQLPLTSVSFLKSIPLSQRPFQPCVPSVISPEKASAQTQKTKEQIRTAQMKEKLIQEVEKDYADSQQIIPAEQSIIPSQQDGFNLGFDVYKRTNKLIQSQNLLERLAIAGIQKTDSHANLTKKRGISLKPKQNPLKSKEQQPFATQNPIMSAMDDIKRKMELDRFYTRSKYIKKIQQNESKVTKIQQDENEAETIQQSQNQVIIN